MIDIKSLTKDDVSKWVRYIKDNRKSELGKIKSWNKTFVFVVYKCSGDWNNFKNYTGIPTDAKDLTFCGAEPMSKSDILYEGQDYEGGNEDES